ncbi:hypothetical protein BGX28_005867 [Mortierella sp. GBA30]|nr:hypothetical protein BGX28_005867 [Mortierella sp. GBA30]
MATNPLASANQAHSLNFQINPTQQQQQQQQQQQLLMQSMPPMQYQTYIQQQQQQLFHQQPTQPLALMNGQTLMSSFQSQPLQSPISFYQPFSRSIQQAGAAGSTGPLPAVSQHTGGGSASTGLPGFGFNNTQPPPPPPTKKDIWAAQQANLQAQLNKNNLNAGMIGEGSLDVAARKERLQQMFRHHHQHYSQTTTATGTGASAASAIAGLSSYSSPAVNPEVTTSRAVPIASSVVSMPTALASPSATAAITNSSFVSTNSTATPLRSRVVPIPPNKWTVNSGVSSPAFIPAEPGLSLPVSALPNARIQKKFQQQHLQQQMLQQQQIQQIQQQTQPQQQQPQLPVPHAEAQIQAHAYNQLPLGSQPGIPQPPPSRTIPPKAQQQQGSPSPLMLQHLQQKQQQLMQQRIATRNMTPQQQQMAQTQYQQQKQLEHQQTQLHQQQQKIPLSEEQQPKQGQVPQPQLQHKHQRLHQPQHAGQQRTVSAGTARTSSVDSAAASQVGSQLTSTLKASMTSISASTLKVDINQQVVQLCGLTAVALRMGKLTAISITVKQPRGPPPKPDLSPLPPARFPAAVKAMTLLPRVAVAFAAAQKSMTHDPKALSDRIPTVPSKTANAAIPNGMPTPPWSSNDVESKVLTGSAQDILGSVPASSKPLNATTIPIPTTNATTSTAITTTITTTETTTTTLSHLVDQTPLQSVHVGDDAAAPAGEPSTTAASKVSVVAVEPAQGSLGAKVASTSSDLTLASTQSDVLEPEAGSAADESTVQAVDTLASATLPNKGTEEPSTAAEGDNTIVTLTRTDVTEVATSEQQQRDSGLLSGVIEPVDPSSQSATSIAPSSTPVQRHGHAHVHATVSASSTPKPLSLSMTGFTGAESETQYPSPASAKAFSVPGSNSSSSPIVTAQVPSTESSYAPHTVEQQNQQALSATMPPVQSRPLMTEPMVQQRSRPQPQEQQSASFSMIPEQSQQLSLSSKPMAHPVMTIGTIGSTNAVGLQPTPAMQGRPVAAPHSAQIQLELHQQHQTSPLQMHMMQQQQQHQYLQRQQLQQQQLQQQLQQQRQLQQRQLQQQQLLVQQQQGPPQYQWQNQHMMPKHQQRQFQQQPQQHPHRQHHHQLQQQSHNGQNSPMMSPNTASPAVLSPPSISPSLSGFASVSHTLSQGASPASSDSDPIPAQTMMMISGGEQSLHWSPAAMQHMNSRSSSLQPQPQPQPNQGGPYPNYQQQQQEQQEQQHAQQYPTPMLSATSTELTFNKNMFSDDRIEQDSSSKDDLPLPSNDNSGDSLLLSMKRGGGDGSNLEVMGPNCGGSMLAMDVDMTLTDSLYHNDSSGFGGGINELHHPRSQHDYEISNSGLGDLELQGEDEDDLMNGFLNL